VNRTPDLPAEDARVAVLALQRASQHLLDQLEGLTHESVQAPSLLPNWSRANLITHLAYVGRALVRMTDEALANGATSTYLRGPEERAESIKRGNHMPTDLLRKELTVSIDELDRMWSGLSEFDWETPFILNGAHDVRLTRLLMLRWMEVEVHASDFGFDGPGFDVSELFIAAALPLRIAWLVQHHRSREDADHSVRGIWHLRATTSHEAWTIKTANATHECIIEGSDHDLLGFILGRVPVSDMVTSGNVGLAHRFKLAFPGP